MVMVHGAGARSYDGWWLVQEVELAVREYDMEVAERHQELMQEQAAYDDLCARMKVHSSSHHAISFICGTNTDSCFTRVLLQNLTLDRPNNLSGLQCRAPMSSAKLNQTYPFIVPQLSVPIPEAAEGKICKSSFWLLSMAPSWNRASDAAVSAHGKHIVMCRSCRQSWWK